MVDKERVGDSVPLPLPHALEVEVREGLPLTVAVRHCDTERLEDSVEESVLDTQADTLGEAETHCDPDSVAL